MVWRYFCLATTIVTRRKDCLMNRIALAAIAAFAVLGLSACGTIGKGKGKAPAPVDVVEPAPAPVYK